MELFRPTGISELKLVYESGMESWPPRLPEQPIFYPVTNFSYAAQIAQEWNSTSGEYAGYVTRFSVKENYASKFDRKIVGGKQHEELWVPAEMLDEFNRNIEGKIEVLAAFFGEKFLGLIPDKFMLRGKNARDQFISLAGILAYDGMDFHCEITANNSYVFLHYPYWTVQQFDKKELSGYSQKDVLAAIRTVWEGAYPNIKLPIEN